MYLSTKLYRDLGPVAYRQWRAESHCNLLHGYSLSFKFTFASLTLDARRWVVDFGGLKPLKGILEDNFDHTTLVAEDDPLLTEFRRMEQLKLCKLVILPNLGCEALAETVYHVTDQWLQDAGYGDRVRVAEVEVMEHGANSAIYRNENLQQQLWFPSKNREEDGVQL